MKHILIELNIYKDNFKDKNLLDSNIMLYSFMNNSNMKKFPDEFKNIPFLGYFNHNINSIIPNKYINKQLINKKYTNNIFINNPYIGYINHSIPLTIIW